MRTAREPRGQGEPRPANMVEAAGSRDPPARGSEGRAAGLRGFGASIEVTADGRLRGERREESAKRGTRRGEDAEGRTRRGSATGLLAQGGRRREQDGEAGLTCHGGLRAAMALGAAAPLPSVSAASAAGPGGPGRQSMGRDGSRSAPDKMARSGPAPAPSGLGRHGGPGSWRGKTASCSLREKPPAAGTR